MDSFEEQLTRIRDNVEAFLKDGDVSHMKDNQAAWDALRAMGRDQEASAIFQEEALKEMAEVTPK